MLDDISVNLSVSLSNCLEVASDVGCKIFFRLKKHYNCSSKHFKKKTIQLGLNSERILIKCS